MLHTIHKIFVFIYIYCLYIYIYTKCLYIYISYIVFLCAFGRVLTHGTWKTMLHSASTDGEVSRAAICEAESAAGDSPLPGPKGRISCENNPCIGRRLIAAALLTANDIYSIVARIFKIRELRY